VALWKRGPAAEVAGIPGGSTYQLAKNRLPCFEARVGFLEQTARLHTVGAMVLKRQRIPLAALGPEKVAHRSHEDRGQLQQEAREIGTDPV
jgi:hypothetical protein